MTHAERLAVAHDSLCLREPPYLKHFKDGRFSEWDGVVLVGSNLPGPGFNFAAVLRPDAPTLDQLLPVAQDFFEIAKDGWGVLVEGDAGQPMEAELRERGWNVDEDEPAFVMPDIAAALPAIRHVKGLTFRRVATLADIAAYSKVTAAAFHAPPEFADAMVPSPAYALDPDIALFVGNANGEDVTAISFSRSDDTAVIAGTATLEEHRGKGYGAAGIRAALEEAVRRGCVSASLRSGPLSVPLYERCGFQFVCRHRTYRIPGAPG
jgi:GNAT superfamily N-acetyltransferase